MPMLTFNGVHTRSVLWIIMYVCFCEDKVVYEPKNMFISCNKNKFIGACKDMNIVVDALCISYEIAYNMCTKFRNINTNNG